MPGTTWHLCLPPDGCKQPMGMACTALDGVQWGGDPGPHLLSLPSSFCSPTLGCVPILLHTGTRSLSLARMLGHPTMGLSLGGGWQRGVPGLATVTLCQLLGTSGTVLASPSMDGGPYTFALGFSLPAAVTGPGGCGSPCPVPPRCRAPTPDGCSLCSATKDPAGPT